jgi:hypothetical protein
MKLTLLTVPACPNAAAFEERLAAALAGHPGAVVHRREVADEREAAEAGMHGSPTLLIDGADPFAGPDDAPSLSCRLYRDTAGRTGGAPPVEVLIQALAEAGRGCDGPSEQVSCGYLNFFAAPASARDWASQHPGITGSVLDQARAETLGAETFGWLLSDGT